MGLDVGKSSRLVMDTLTCHNDTSTGLLSWPLALVLRGSRQCRGRSMALRSLRLPECLLEVCLCFLGEQNVG